MTVMNILELLCKTFTQAKEGLPTYPLPLKLQYYCDTVINILHRSLTSYNPRQAMYKL